MDKPFDLLENHESGILLSSETCLFQLNLLREIRPNICLKICTAYNPHILYVLVI